MTQTYNLPVVHLKNVDVLEDVGELAPEAGYLLTVAPPSLTLEQANKILTETEGPGGGFLDDGSSFGVYSRLNLYCRGRARRTGYRWQVVQNCAAYGAPFCNQFQPC